MPRTVLFVDQTPGGELALRLRELLARIEDTIGFKVKVVERSGRSLQAMFPLTTLWDGTSCGRVEDCTTCYQGAEAIPDCTRKSVLYKNFCATCVPAAMGRGPVKDEDVKTKEPAVYVGETSRSIAERSREHWSS